MCPVTWDSGECESREAPLNDEQRRVLEMVVDQGKNIFFTGAAGAHSVTASTPPPLTFVVRR